MEAMIWIGLIILFVLVEIDGRTDVHLVRRGRADFPDSVPVRRGTGLADRRIFRGFPDSGGIYPAVGGEVFKAASDPDQLRAGNR